MSILVALHILISLAGLASGFAVLYGIQRARFLNGWTASFLITTAATSLTGFLLPARALMPSHVVAVLSLLVLGLAAISHYRFHLEGGWRKTYAISAVVALYFNFFVLVAQLFAKVPPLKAMAPTQSEAPFQLAQIVVLTAFVFLGYRSVAGSAKLPV
ncbi:MAG TPA: hypothetical protein VNH18_03825 [Bryobacteraceae bacterium]|nr:hypothetical protein [Bryobacteraceae bacterium]